MPKNKLRMILDIFITTFLTRKVRTQISTKKKSLLAEFLENLKENGENC